MDWFLASIAAWFGWNVVAPFICLIFVVAILGLLEIPRRARQMKCPHERYRETMSCDAVCTSCGKNLGFIGAVRDKARATQ